MKKLYTISAALMLVLLMAPASVAQDGPSSRPSREGRRGRPADDNAPKAGETAPVFRIKTLDGKNEFELASLKGKRPVVLFFGSYT